MRSSANAVSVGCPAPLRWATSEPTNPAGTVTFCVSNGVSVVAAPALRISTRCTPAGIGNGSVLRSGWNVGSTNVPSRYTSATSPRSPCTTLTVPGSSGTWASAVPNAATTIASATALDQNQRAMRMSMSASIVGPPIRRSVDAPCADERDNSAR